MTELSHPLYQLAHDAAYKEVKRRFPQFNRENLWAPPAKAFTREELDEALQKAGFKIVRITETLVPIAGHRIVEFVRNGWTTWCRWDPLDKLPIEEKLEIVGVGLGALFKGLEDYESFTAYHPTVIITARKE